MKYQAYEKYKKSDIEYLEKIPIDWMEQRIKDVGKIFGRIGFRGYTISDMVDEGEGAITLSPSNINNFNLVLDKCAYISWQKYNESPEIKVFSNDVIIVKTGSTIGKATFVPECEKKMTINPQLIVIKNIKVNFKYLYYLIISTSFQFEFSIYTAGGSTPAISQEKINSFVFPLPVKKIQKIYAEYLGEKTEFIDKKIESLKKKKEKYFELKQSLINEVVTKGLDKNAEMKESGIEWIEKIPKHWEVKRGKDQFYYNKKINKGLICKNVLSLTYGGVINKNFNTTAGLNPESYETYQFVNKNDLIFKLIDLENIKTSRVGIVHEDGIMSSAYIRLNPSKYIISGYYYYLYFYYYKINLFNYLGGGVRSTLNYSDLLEISIIIPPKQEQEKIISYLDEKTKKIDNINKTIDKNIRILKEFRKTLINDVMTGKVKVV